MGRWCVTVMDNWTPRREFWTLRRALQFYRKHDTCAHLWYRPRGKWIEVRADRHGVEHEAETMRTLFARPWWWRFVGLDHMAHL